MSPKKLLSLALLFLASNFIFCQSLLFPIVSKKVTIGGKVIVEKQTYKTGQFSYFDGISRIPNSKTFNLAKDGSFSFEFNLMHAVYGTAYFNVAGKFYPMFLEPGESYKLEIKDGLLSYIDGTGKVNEEITKVRKLIYETHKAEAGELVFLHKKNLPVEETIKKHKAYEKNVLSFLGNYSAQNKLSETSLRVLTNEFRFKTAAAWINARYEHTDNHRKLIKNLPEDFFIKLHNDYPVNVEDAYISREYIDYISNIGTVLTASKESSVDGKIAFFKTFNKFSDKELELIKKVYSGDKAIRETKEYKTFFNPKSALRIDLLNRRYDVHKFLIAVPQFPDGIGRDLIISQFISKKYFKNGYVPLSKEEWKTIEKLVSEEEVVDQLKLIAARLSGNDDSIATDGSNSAIIEKPTKESLTKKYLEPFKGKVIYIDFWATWCGPCRREEPHARRLAEEFKKDEVVFLNLCCQSKSSNWKSYVKQKDLHGENFLLSNDEFRLFAEMYNLKGFPTYVLIDKNGKVKTTDARWPSDYKRAVRQIDSLLR